MKILWGYIASIGYLFAVILICGAFQKRRSLNVEISRKVIHVAIAFTWCIMDVFWGRSYHQAILSALFVVINFLSYKFKFLPGVERQSKSHPGTVYYALAMLALSIASYYYEPMYLYFGASVFFLSFGDGLAPIFGWLLKGNRLLTKNKTLYGSLACFVFGTAALWAFTSIYKTGVSLLCVFGIGAIATLAELFAVKGLDNFTVSFTVALGLIAEYFGVVSDAFWVSAIISLPIILTALYFKALTPPAAVVAEAFMLVSAYCMDYTLFLVYVIPFVCIAVVGIFKKRDKVKLGLPSKARGVVQVLINGLPALICFVVYKVTDAVLPLVMGATALCSCFVDSCASDVGYFSKKTPYDFIRRKKVDKGISGGITLLGSIACIVGAIIFTLSFWINQELSYAFIFVFLGGVLGCTLDTLIGSLFQALYAVEIPLEPIDEPIYPTQKYKYLETTQDYKYLEAEQEYKYLETKGYWDSAKLVKGVKFIDNNVVNLLSSVLSAVITGVVYYCVFSI